MLVLSSKLGERIVIGDNTLITVVRIDRNQIRLNIEAPPTIPVYRENHEPARSELQRVREQQVVSTIFNVHEPPGAITPEGDYSARTHAGRLVTYTTPDPTHPVVNQLTHSLKQRYPGLAVIVCPYQVEPELRLSVPAGTDPAESSRLGAEIESLVRQAYEVIGQKSNEIDGPA
jgi:carbon storage regulator